MFSDELDTDTLNEFADELGRRLKAKRDQGRTGWELMTDVEIADLMCKVINKGNGANFYVDLTNLLMFAHALECDPVIIRGVLEEHLGRNYQCRQEAFAKYDIQQEEIDNAKPQTEPERPEPQVEPMPVDGWMYNLRINGVGSSSKYIFCKSSEQFKECDDRGRLLKGAKSYPLGGCGVEWGEA